MFGNKITKTIFIEGMSCGHCSKRVEDALKKVKEVKSVEINLDDKKAVVTLKIEVENEILKAVIEELGFKVIKIFI